MALNTPATAGDGVWVGSMFLRDCKRCRVVAACGQFRTRDCQQIDTYLHCATQPIIEASTQMRFACYQLHYPQLKGGPRFCNSEAVTSLN